MGDTENTKPKAKPKPKVSGYVVLTDHCVLGDRGDWIPADAETLAAVNMRPLERAGHVQQENR